MHANIGSTWDVMMMAVFDTGALLNVAHRVVQWMNGFGHGEANFKPYQEPAFADTHGAARQARFEVLEAIPRNVASFRGMDDEERGDSVGEFSCGRVNRTGPYILQLRGCMVRSEFSGSFSKMPSGGDLNKLQIVGSGSSSSRRAFSTDIRHLAVGVAPYKNGVDGIQSNIPVAAFGGIFICCMQCCRGALKQFVASHVVMALFL